MEEQGTILCAGEADSEGEVLRDWMLEMCRHLRCRTAGMGEGEDVTVAVAVAVAEGIGQVGGEDLEWVWEASRVTSTVEGPRTIRWTRLTLISNSGVSCPMLLSFVFAPNVHSDRIS